MARLRLLGTMVMVAALVGTAHATVLARGVSWTLTPFFAFNDAGGAPPSSVTRDAHGNLSESMPQSLRAVQVLGLVAAFAGTGIPALSDRFVPVAQTHPYHVLLTADESVNGYAAEFQQARSQSIDPRGIHVDRASLDGAIERRDVATVSGPVLPSSFNPQTQVAPLSVPRAMLRPGMQQLILRLDATAVSRADGTPLTTKILGSVNVHLPAAASPAPSTKRLENTTVFPIGVVTLGCDPRMRPTPMNVSYGPPSLAAIRPLHVVAVDRRIGTAAIVRSRFGQSNPVFSAFAYKAIDPLRISFDPVLESKAGDIDATPFAIRNRLPNPAHGTNMIETIRAQLNWDGCRSITLLASDPWDVSLLLSTTAPPRSITGDVQLGMTRDDVASRLGFHSEFADRDDFNRRHKWHYVRDGPFSSTVIFRGRRVSRYDPPEHLP